MEGTSPIRYFAKLAYHGAAYHGWQVQNNAHTVQAEINQALSTITRQPVNVVGCGRTDTGVHAKEFFLHFDLPQRFEQATDLAFKLNCLLPKDIVIHQVFETKPDMHARFSALSRTYEYHLSTQKDPFQQGRAYYFRKPLDVDLMNEAAASLADFTDFTTFSKLHTQVKTNNCVVSQAVWKTDSDPWVFTIRADRFLRNMVRAVVGTLIMVGEKKMDLEGFKQVIEAKNRQLAGPSVPAEGLYLVRVEYPDELFNVASSI